MNGRLAGAVSFVLILFTFPFSFVVQASSDDVFKVLVDPQAPLIHAGETGTFEIRVANLSDNVDRYMIEVSDDAGWNLELQENLLEGVGPGENRTVTLKVTVPGDTKIGFQDNITVSVINSTDIRENIACKIGVLRGDVTDWSYVATGVGVVIAAIILVLVLWKGGL